MPIHQTLWKYERNLFHDEAGWALTSELCRWYAGGLLAHLPALAAFCAPTTNSYRRLLPGTGPTDPLLSATRKTAACRIPARNTAPGARRIKFWGADSMANPYLAFAAVILAGLDGIERKLEAPLDGAAPHRNGVPHCLESALEALAADRGFLTGSDVFSDQLIDAWIQERWASQVVPVRSHPHPSELTGSDLPGATVEAPR
jgi:glutamine synthetase